MIAKDTTSQAALTSTTDVAPLLDASSSSPAPPSRMEVEALPAPSPLPLFECRNRQWYFAYASRDLIFEKTVDLQGTLLGSKVNPLTRAQMLDWMIEVLSNLGRQFSEATFFRAAQLMDMFFKLSRAALTDASVHLVGLTCMYIGSKYEDVEPLRIQELSRDAAYNKFSPQQIREREVQILHALKYQTSFKTQLEVLDFFYFRIFGDVLSDRTRALRDLTRNFCIQVLACVTFNDYDVRYVVLSCLLNAATYLAQLTRAGKSAERGASHRVPGPSSVSSARGVPLSDDLSHLNEAAEFAELSRRLRAYVETEIRRGRYPVEIWQLVEFVRSFLKKFRKEYQVCPQMCRLLELDPRCLTKEGC